MKTRTFTTVAAVICAAGCYSYVPADLDQVPLRSDVQAILSTEGEINLRNRVGLAGGRLTGELVEKTQEQLFIAVPTTGPFTGSTGERLVQRIDVPRRDVLMVQVREPSTPKTVGLLAAAVGAATTVAVLTLSQDRNPGDSDVDPPGPDERIAVRLPFLIRIP